MDVATRVQPRMRAHSHLDRERNGASNESGDESDSIMHHKAQCSTVENESPADTTFRKPSLPASASKTLLDNRQSVSQRRRSNIREHRRVPSGLRELPSPGKRLGSGSISSLTPSAIDSASAHRSLLPSAASKSSIGKTSDAPRFSLGPPPSNGAHSPDASTKHSADNFDFMPAVNFDDIQNSIATYEGNGPLLSDFPAIGGQRSLLGGNNASREKGTAATRPFEPKSDVSQEESVRRSQSLRRRLSAVTAIKQTPQAQASNTAMTHQGTVLSTRARRQSAAPNAAVLSGSVTHSAGAGVKAPRKSLGPGLISSMMDGRKISQPLPSSASDTSMKSSPVRTNSLTTASRRTMLQPSASAPSAELPRISTLTATTQSRANKVKSLQPSPREPDVSTPSNRTSAKGGSQNRAHTPSSSGNKRQSTISGRASGLGARTISPTDARRLKRLSMMQAPPIPTFTPKAPPSPQEEMPAFKLEAPRVTQPSPSLMLKGNADGTPTSDRPSPEVRPGTTGGLSLSSKSSYQSLLSASTSMSRLPTPKPRSSHSSSAQYSEPEEMVPPVPAIPKAYESPRESEVPFFSGARSSQSGIVIDSTSSDPERDGSFVNIAALGKTQKLLAESALEQRRKPSGDHSRLHSRTNTAEAMDESADTALPPKPARLPIDETGRKNNNLQPLRLPPLNLMPIALQTPAGLPRPSQEVDSRNEWTVSRTPEHKRTAKTPSTPMTASKATFFRRQEEELAAQGAVRSSTSHFALRELMQLDDSTLRFFDDNDLDFLNGGVQIPGAKPRNAITPFTSGSLPKGSSEYSRLRERLSGDYDDEYSLGAYDNLQLQSAKPQGSGHARNGTNHSLKTAEIVSKPDSTVAESAQPDIKKEGSGGGLRRKMSLGWRRSSSKAASHIEHKSSPHQDTSGSDKEKSKQKRVSEMPPPKLPASAMFNNDAPSLPRPSLDSSRRKSTAVSVSTLSTATSGTDGELADSVAKTRSLHIEQPQSLSNAHRASSWGNIGSGTRPSNIKPVSVSGKPRHTLTPSTISATTKDKDDLAADEEMRRLSQKRRDVDSAARESEDLKRRAVARSPMTPERVLHDRNFTLNIFERGEIMDYEKDGIFFTGTKTARKVIGSLTPSSQPSIDDKNAKAGNYGYDDERGDYNIVLGDHLAYRYEVVDVLGKGSFGQVVRCVDHKAGGVVAVKIIRNKKRFHQQALVEVGILGRLREWDPEGHNATLSITTSFYFRSHLCIVTPCLSINLYELIRAHNFVGFSFPLIRRFARQLLACLVLLQNKRIIHCDMKPENILLCEARKADVRVIDFGSSCKEEEKVYTYIQSRFYRSPEVILGSSYGLGIDMWSLGCILAELWTGYPLFPGENEQEQLACIMEIFGPPDRHLVERCTRKKLFFDSVGKPRVTVSSKGRRRRPSSKTLSQALKTEDEAFLDFIARCLRWDPDRRMKPHEAVTHPFITNLPFHQRQGIPDEARRATKARPTTAAPATTGAIPSPIKRVHTTTGVTASSHTTIQSSTQQTPAKDRTRGLPETPQTALRNGASTTVGRNGQASPSKPAGTNRRISTAATSNTAAVTGSKRASNGLAIGAAGLPNLSSGGSSRQASGNLGSGIGLAQMAARESITNAAKWKT